MNVSHPYWAEHELSISLALTPGGLAPRGLRPLGAHWHPSRFSLPPSLLRLWIFTNLSLPHSLVRGGFTDPHSLAPQYYSISL